MWKFLGKHNYRASKHLTSNVIFSVILLGTSVFTYGFETAVIATVQAMDHYEKQFGQFNTKTKKWEITASRLAYLNSFPLITYGLGVVGASLVSQRWGRRIVVGIMNVICIAGVLLSLFATNYGQALGGRLILYIHVGMEAVLVPMYLAEIVPAAIRGSVVATYAFSHMFAAFIASIITNFTSRIDSNVSWQLPIGLVLIFPVFVLATITILPESPRWLLRQEHYQKAVDSLYYLHGARPEYNGEEEANLIMETIRTATSQGRWSELFKGANKRRTWIGIMCAAATQLTGQTFASNYGAVFLKQLNIMDPFTGTMIKRALLVGACLFVIFFVEHTGRRRMAITAGVICAACLMLMGGLGTIKSPSRGTSLTILAMTIIFPTFFTVGFGSNMQVVKSEIPHTSLRDKSIMVHWSVANVCNFLATFTTPYLLKAPYANLGPKVGLIFGSISTVFIILLFLYMPEMTNRSLEEIDEMMEAKVPAWKTREWKATGLGSMLTKLDNGDRLEKGEEVTVEARVATTEVK